MKIDYSEVKKNINQNTSFSGDIQDYYKYFTGTLTNLNKTFPSTYISKWKFELICTKIEDMDEYILFYQKMYHIIHQVLGITEIGLRAFSDGNNLDASQILKSLGIFSGSGCKIAFITFTVYLMEDFSGMTQENFRGLADYHTKIADKILDIIKEANLSEIPIYMIEWNTLCAKNSQVLAGTFFRSAIILDNILTTMSKIEGIGFNLNTFETLAEVRRFDVSTLALFLCFRIKRPVFFVIDVCNQLGSEVLYDNNHILITRTINDEINIVVYYPVYTDPLLSADYAFVGRTKRELDLTLENLIEGNYQIKKLVYDSIDDGIYKRLDSLGYPDLFDEDVVEYMESAILPRLTVMEEHIKDSYTLQTKIEFNGIVQYKIKKV